MIYLISSLNSEKIGKMRSSEKACVGKIIIILLVINGLCRCKYGRFWCIFATKKLHRSGTDRII